MAQPFPVEPNSSRFALSGHSRSIDPRVDPVRRDLAHISYAGLVFVPSYARPVVRRVLADGSLRSDQREDSQVLSEVRSGEVFEVLELAEHRAWGRSPVDGVVGFVDATVIGEAVRGATPLATSPVAGEAAAVAEKLLGTPWREGGRSASGLDSSGFVYLALQPCAKSSAPRFVDLQLHWGMEAPTDAPMERGDVLIYPDHAGIATGTDEVIHLPRGGKVERIELERLAAEHGLPLARRRIQRD